MSLHRTVRHPIVLLYRRNIFKCTLLVSPGYMSWIANYWHCKAIKFTVYENFTHSAPQNFNWKALICSQYSLLFRYIGTSPAGRSIYGYFFLILFIETPAHARHIVVLPAWSLVLLRHWAFYCGVMRATANIGLVACYRWEKCRFGFTVIVKVQPWGKLYKPIFCRYNTIQKSFTSIWCAGKVCLTSVLFNGVATPMRIGFACIRPTQCPFNDEIESI